MNYDSLILEPFREMTAIVLSFIPTLLFALGILIVGTFLAHAVQNVVARVFKQIEFDTVSDKMGITKALHNGGIRRTPSPPTRRRRARAPPRPAGGSAPRPEPRASGPGGR